MDDFAGTPLGKFYIPLIVSYKALGTASKLNGFAYNNAESNTQSSTFIYTNTSPDSRNITWIGTRCQDHNLTFEVHVKY